MSTILKALKKLEADQRMATPTNLAGKIVTADRGGSRSGTNSAVLVGVGISGGLLLALVLLGAWLWWRPASPDNVVQSAPAPAMQPVVVQQEAEKPLPVTVDPGPMTALPPKPMAPVTTPQRQPEQAQTAELSLPAPTLPATAPQARTVAQPPLEPTTRQVTVTDRQIPPPGQQWAAPHLEVSDIFPPVAGQSRMAVVNGLPVMAGTMVEDALVEEIRADRVLFTIHGKTVAVPLSQGR